MNIFDKTISKIIIDTIADKVENEIIKSSLKDYARIGEFGKAAKLISEIITDWQKKEKSLHNIRTKIRDFTLDI